MAIIPSIDTLPAWQQLSSLSGAMKIQRIAELFKQHPARAKQFEFASAHLRFNISRQCLEQKTLDMLLALASQRGLAAGIQQLFSGEPLNFTEQRAVSHMAARLGMSNASALQNAAQNNLSNMETFAQKIHAGALLGATGKPLKAVVNIGIGGSDLGPRLLTQALMAGQRALVPIYFVASVDPADLTEALLDLNPEETLFIISSKSFTTPETLSNAHHARQWLKQSLGNAYTESAVMLHFAGITNNPIAAHHFGIAQEQIFDLPATVGGRFSVWSTVGLSAMLAIGVQRFRDFLAGGKSMDEHFSTTPLAHNLPIIMALVALWNSQFLDIETLAVLPYSHALRGFPAYLQQLEMESNGKAVGRDGQTLAYHTAQIVWGAAGTNGQHAFHQLFYQGTRRCALDFIVPTDFHCSAQQALLINAQAQAQALIAGQDLETSKTLLRAQGKNEEAVHRLAPHLVSPGNQPSSMLFFETLTPQVLGELMALYEHKVFVLGWLWGINSFDQFGVELGKDMARKAEMGAQQ